MEYSERHGRQTPFPDSRYASLALPRCSDPRTISYHRTLSHGLPGVQIRRSHALALQVSSPDVAATDTSLVERHIPPVPAVLYSISVFSVPVPAVTSSTSLLGLPLAELRR